MENFKVFYLHGFGSSPNSSKGKMLTKQFGKNLLGIDLSGSPLTAMSKMRKLIVKNKGQRIVLVGSSLGAFYATYLSAIFDIPAVLVNPPTRPWESIPQFDPSYPEKYKTELKKIVKLTNSADGLMSMLTVLLGTEDEHLDYTTAVTKYLGAKIILRKDVHLFHKNNALIVSSINDQLEFARVFESVDVNENIIK